MMRINGEVILWFGVVVKDRQFLMNEILTDGNLA